MDRGERMNRLTHGSRTLGDRMREACEMPVDHAPGSAPRSGYFTSRAPLLETPYCSIETDPHGGFYRFTRTERPYPSSAAVEAEANAIERVLDKYGRPRLLVDLRAAAPRNDPGFEVAVAKLRHNLFKGSERSAILVKTAVGALQVKRHMREDGFSVEVFQTEEDAIAHLEGHPDSASRGSSLPPSPMSRAPHRLR
jgi:hypothetical protein